MPCRADTPRTGSTPLWYSSGSQVEAFFEALQTYLQRPWRSARRSQGTAKYDLAILCNPDELLPPSNAKALRRFVQAALTVTVLLTFSQAILAFALAAAIRAADTPRRRTLAKALAAVLVVAMAALTAVHLTFSPVRPWAPEIRPGPCRPSIR